MKKIVLLIALVVCHASWAATYTLQNSDELVGTSNTITSCSAAITGFDIIFSSGANGSIDGELEQNVNVGEDATSVLAVPADGYAFFRWVDENGNLFSTQNPLTLSNVVRGYSLTALFCSNNIMEFKPVKDASIMKKDYYPERATTNYGQTVAINLYDSEWAARDSVHALIDFGQLDIPLENISTATLRLYHYSDKDNEGSNSFSVYSYTQDWEEDVVTWSNCPGIEVGASVVSHPATVGKEPIDVDVLSLLKESGEQTIASFYLKLNEGVAQQNDIVYIASKDHENANIHPRLFIDLLDGATGDNKEESVDIIFSSGANGSIDGELEQNVNVGEDATSVLAVPADGYAFFRWVDENGNLFSTQNPLTLSNVVRGYSLTALFCSNNIMEFRPVKDASIMKKDYYPERATTNYGQTVAINLYDSEWYARDSVHALIDFGQLNIPLENISTATLRLYHYSDKDNEGSNSFSVYSYTQDWEEDVVTWSNCPGVEVGASVVSHPATVGKEPIDVDVLSLLKESGEQTIASFYLKLNEGVAQQNDIVYIASKDHENANIHPRLFIDLLDGATGIYNEKEESVKFYPNPASNEITIDLAKSQKAQITIVDLKGSVVLSENISQSRASINIANLNRGVYVLNVKTVDESYTHKLMVE